MYVARVGANVTKDIRVTLEGMVVNEQSLAGQSFGDTFFVGATVGAKLGDIQLDGALVYGMRAFAPSAAAIAGGRNPNDPFSEEGFGAFVTARFPVGPVSLFVVGWYTTGDDTVGPAGCAGPGNNAGCVRAGWCTDPERRTRTSSRSLSPALAGSAAAARTSRSGSSVTRPSVPRPSVRSSMRTRPARGAWARP